MDKFSTTWQRLTAPSGSLEPPHRQRAQHLASLVLGFLVIGSLLSLVQLAALEDPQTRFFRVSGSLLTILLLFISYQLSRTRFYVAGAVTFILFLDLMISYSARSMNAQQTTGAATLMIIFLIPILLGVMFLPYRYSVLATLLHLALVVLLSVSVLDLSLRQASSSLLVPLGFVVALFYFFVHERIGHERERQAELREHAAQLRQSHLLLEERVKERTAELRMTNESLQRQILERTQAEHALRESESRFRTISELVSDFAYVYARAPNGSFANEWRTDAFQHITGYDFEEAWPKRSYFALPFHPRHEFVARQHMQTLLSGQVAVSEWCLLTREGLTRWVQVIDRPILDEAGQVVRIYGSAQDITRRKEAEDLLRQRNRELATMNSVTGAASQTLEMSLLLSTLQQQLYQVLYVPGGGIVLYDETARAFEMQLSWGPAGAVWRLLPFATHCEPAIRQQAVVYDPDLWPLLAADKALTETTWPGWKSHLCVPLVAGHEVKGALRVLSQGEPFSDEQVTFFTNLGQQVGIAIQNAQLYEQVISGRERLRRLAQQVVAAQENERQTMSRELHDEAGQTLTALKFHLAMIRDDLPVPTGPNAEAATIHRHLDDAVALVEQTMSRVRALAHGLRPQVLDSLGLHAALSDLCREFTGHTQLEVDYAGLRPPPLSSEAEISLYRFVQEGLTNVVKHAEATQVKVRLRHDGQAVYLTITDNGRGMPRATALLGSEGGMGLAGMQERLALVNGSLEIVSQPGQGTHLKAQVPLPPRQGRLTPGGSQAETPGLIRIVLAEDHHVVRAAVAQWLNKEPDIRVVGEVTEGGTLLAAVLDLQPDLLIMDAQMPNHKVVEATSALLSRLPDLRILILTAYDRREYLVSLLNAGIHGYVLKDDAPETLVQAIRAVVGGGQWLSPRLMPLLTDPAGSTPAEPLAQLTGREMDILRLLVEGSSNEQIAQALMLAPQTVRNHARNLYGKLGVSSRLEAVLYAMNHGLAPLSGPAGDDPTT